MTGTNNRACHPVSAAGRNVEERLFTAALRFGQRRASALVVVFADAAIPTGAKAHLKTASNAALSAALPRCWGIMRWAEIAYWPARKGEIKSRPVDFLGSAFSSR
jgi:hypothetical protein